MTELDEKLDYAAHLASFGNSLIGEDLLKLASLCNEIVSLKKQSVFANARHEEEFYTEIIKLYKSNAQFRMEIDRHPATKKIMSNTNS